MTTDLLIAPELGGKFRRDWGLQNMVGLDRQPGTEAKNNVAQNNVRHKIARFVQLAVYPQQLSIPRQYATTREGVFIYKIFEGRTINGIQEQGARVVIQENKQMARFVISPLFSSKHDALSWAKQHMGAE